MNAARSDRMHPTEIDVPPGLAGVVVAETEIGDVRGLEGSYHYRGYPAVELARSRSFSDVWRLVLAGDLPDPTSPASIDFANRAREGRDLHPTVRAALPVIAGGTTGLDPLSGLRTALSLAGGQAGLRPLFDLDPDARIADAVTVAAWVPTLVAALHRLRNGQDPVLPRDDLDHVANFLWMLTATEPDHRQVEALRTYLVSTIDHGLNASTFTARVIASTGADLAASVVGALGALSGPLHGGAPSRALALLDLGSVDRARSWARDQIAAGGRLMGFGHPVYRTLDPRSEVLKEVARSIGGDRIELATQIEAAVLEVLEELKPGRGLRTNVEFYAALVMEAAGVPSEEFTSTFAVARTVGWTAHALEQVQANKIIRPSSRYVGPQAP